MKLTWSFFTFIIVCLSGVFSHAIVNEVDTTQLSKRSYRMEVPNPKSFQLRANDALRIFYKITFIDRKLVATKCFYFSSEYCRVTGSVTIKLQYDVQCSYGNSSIKKMKVFDGDGDEVSELIDLNKVGQNKSAHRYIDIYFNNGCKISAKYNYKDTSMSNIMSTLVK